MLQISLNLGESIGLKFIPSQSELFRVIPESVSDSFRINPKNVLYLVWLKTAKNRPKYSDSIRGIIPNKSEPSFQSKLIRINATSD